MKKIFLLVFAITLIVFILNVGFRSKQTTLQSLNANNNDLAATGFLALKKQVSVESPTALASSGIENVKAFEVEEGERISFGDLSVTVASMESPSECSEVNCLTAHLRVATSEDGEEEVEQVVGETKEYGGYTVKVSQIAPLAPNNTVSRRAVIILTGKD